MLRNLLFVAITAACIASCDNSATGPDANFTGNWSAADVNGVAMPANLSGLTFSKIDFVLALPPADTSKDQFTSSVRIEKSVAFGSSGCTAAARLTYDAEFIYLEPQTWQLDTDCTPNKYRARGYAFRLRRIGSTLTFGDEEPYFVTLTRVAQ